MVHDPDTKAEIIAKVIAAVDEGKSLRQACTELGFPRKTVERWISEDEDIAAQYERARENRAEKIFEEILVIQDEKPERVVNLGADGEGGSERIDPAFVTWQKNRVDTRKWMLGKMSPKRYGDKSQVELSGKLETTAPVEAAAALAAAQEAEAAGEV